MNRKTGKSTVRFGPAIKAVLICLVTCSLGLGYVWQKQQINILGGQIKENEIKLEKLRRENKDGGDRLAFLMSPQQLDERLRKLNLDLEVPLPKQIIVLTEHPRGVPSRLVSASETRASVKTKVDKEFLTGGGCGSVPPLTILIWGWMTFGFNRLCLMLNFGVFRSPYLQCCERGHVFEHSSNICYFLDHRKNPKDF